MSAFEHSIYEIVQATWDSVLQLPVEEADGFDGGTSGAPAFAGVVTISGAWEGAVGVHIEENLGRRAASIMFASDPSAATRQDVEDALAELTNMVGGNLKALLPTPCQLGLPVVVEGTDFRMRVSGGAQIMKRRFLCEGDRFAVTVVERQSS